MKKQLGRHHRIRIRGLGERRKFSKLDDYLQKLASKGFDVAGLPFQLLDAQLGSGADIDTDALRSFGRHTAGAQPRLFDAILTDLDATEPTELMRIAQDHEAHPMTRFEAMGWAVFLTHQATPADHAPSQSSLFQFWDSPTPPPEVAAGLSDWQAIAAAYERYDDVQARDYIATYFGTQAAGQYETLWHPALKSDLFRLYRLAQDGGLYCDADSHPGPQAATFLRNGGDQVWAAAMTQLPNCVTINGFLAAPPKSVLIEAFLNDVLQNICTPGKRGIFWLSGPGALTSFLFHGLGQAEIGLLSNARLTSGIFKQFDAPYKRTARNWRVYEHRLGLNDDAGLQNALSAIE